MFLKCIQPYVQTFYAKRLKFFKIKMSAQQVELKQCRQEVL